MLRGSGCHRLNHGLPCSPFFSELRRNFLETRPDDEKSPEPALATEDGDAVDLDYRQTLAVIPGVSEHLSVIDVFPHPWVTVTTS